MLLNQNFESHPQYDRGVLIKKIFEVIFSVFRDRDRVGALEELVQKLMLYLQDHTVDSQDKLDAFLTNLKDLTVKHPPSEGTITSAEHKVPDERPTTSDVPNLDALLTNLKELAVKHPPSEGTITSAEHKVPDERPTTSDVPNRSAAADDRRGPDTNSSDARRVGSRAWEDANDIHGDGDYKRLYRTRVTFEPATDSTRMPAARSNESAHVGTR
jgi:hypothetical protein